MLEEGLGLSADELHEVFAEWNKGELDSLPDRDHARESSPKKTMTAQPLIDKILDTAGQKGTGKWTAISALDLGMPVTLIGEAVFARCLSALKDERVAASKVLKGPKHSEIRRSQEFIEDVRRALYCSKMISYAQGYMLLREAAKEEGWNLNYGRHRADVARRLHHSQPFPGEDQGSLRQESEAHESVAGRFFQQRSEQLPKVLAHAALFKRSNMESRRPLSPLRLPSTTDIGPSGFRRTCCRPSAISSALTLMSASTNRADSFSIPTGRARGRARRRSIPGQSYQRPMMTSRIPQSAGAVFKLRES